MTVLDQKWSFSSGGPTNRPPERVVDRLTKAGENHEWLNS